MKNKSMMLFVSTFFVLSFVCMFTKPASAYVSLSVSSQLVPSTIGPGDSGNLILTISNGGTSYARRVELNIKSHSFVSFGQKKYELQTIAPSSSAQISVPITVSSSIPEGTTSIFFSITYAEGDATGTNTVETSTSISVSRRSLVQVENVSWSEEIIEPGDIIDVDIDIKNVGSGSVKDMTVILGNESQPFVSASGDIEVYVGDLPSRQTSTASFSIIVSKNANTVAYRVPVTIKYYDEAGTSHTDVKYVGLKISGKPEFVVTLEDDSKMFTGSAGELTLSMANRGTASANYLTVTFDSNLEITPKEYYMGNLDPDDYETITLEVKLAKVPAGKRSMNIEMRYKDPYNQEMTESASLEFTVYSIPPIQISPTTQVIVVVVLIIVIYWKRTFFIKLFKKK